MANQPVPDPSDLPALDALHNMEHIVLSLSGFLVVAILAPRMIKMWLDRSYRPRTARTSTATPPTRSAPPTPNSGPSPHELWTRASQIADDLLARVAAWEFDPNERFFNRPLLADVNEPLTAEWLEAQVAMSAAMDDYKPANAVRAQKALDAAERARDAWDAAWRYAGSIGLATLPERDRQRLAQAQKILAQAADHATTPAEPALCIDRLVTLLADVATVDRTTARHTVTKFVSAQLALPAPTPRTAITGSKRRNTIWVRPRSKIA